MSTFGVGTRSFTRDSGVNPGTGRVTQYAAGSGSGGGGAGDSALGRVGGNGGAGAPGTVIVVEW